jgi:hypothetical protein
MVAVVMTCCGTLGEHLFEFEFEIEVYGFGLFIGGYSYGVVGIRLLRGGGRRRLLDWLLALLLCRPDRERIVRR